MNYIDKLKLVPATSTEVPATQTKWSCPAGSEIASTYRTIATTYYGGGLFGSSAVQQAIPPDKNKFRVGQTEYDYGNPTEDNKDPYIHVCVPQGQSATD